MSKKGLVGTLCIILTISFVSCLIILLAGITSIKKHEFAFLFDRKEGKVIKIDRTGWIFRNPFRYGSHKIDLRPYQLKLNANNRVLNAKLVRFDPNGLNTFISWHGVDAGDNLSNLLEILKSYAFDVENGEDCPFLKVEKRIAPIQGATMLPTIDINEGDNDDKKTGD